MVLLTRLVQNVTEALNIEFQDIRVWTDPMIVLAWIAKDPSRWQTFVSNRVSEIQSTLPYSQWAHVSGKENSADLISRGTSCDKLEDNELWWAGPPWLSQIREPTGQSCDDGDQPKEIQELVEAEARGKGGIFVHISSRGTIELFESFIETFVDVKNGTHTSVLPTLR